MYNFAIALLFQGMEREDSLEALLQILAWLYMLYNVCLTKINFFAKVPWQMIHVFVVRKEVQMHCFAAPSALPGQNEFRVAETIETRMDTGSLCKDSAMVKIIQSSPNG